MTKMRSISDILATDDQTDELYTSDQKRRYKRSKLGRYSRQKGSFDFIHLIRSWEKIVGPMMAKNTIPLKIHNRTLIIATIHSVFAQELQFLIPEILQKITEFYPELAGNITKIKFSYSAQSAYMFNEKKTDEKKEKITRPTLHPFSPEFRKKKADAEKFVAQIEDEDARASILKYLLS